jgi:two-component system, NarL family, nitrate/nitrite response regulator NarL
MPLRVLLADDNGLFREGMVSLLTRCEDVQVVGQAKDAAEAVRKTSLLRPDVVLMDLSMPLGGGVEATRKILEERPTQAICMLTVSEQASDLFSSIRAGARGYLVKTVTLDELCVGLRILADGGSVVTPHLAAELLDEFSKLAQGVREGPSEGEKLTAREREVLELIARGASNKEIANKLVIAENTVKVHLRNILDKLHLRNRQQAAAFAVQEGLVREIRGEEF